MVGHGAKWAKKTNIWPKMTKNTTLGPKLAIFGPNFILGICFDYLWQQNLLQSISKREQAHFSQNDQSYHFRAKIGSFLVNFGKTITLPEFPRTQISLLGSALTVFGSKTHQNPSASVSQIICLKMTKNTILRPKLVVFG